MFCACFIFFSYLETQPAENDEACPHLGNWLCMCLIKNKRRRKEFLVIRFKGREVDSSQKQLYKRTPLISIKCLFDQIVPIQSITYIIFIKYYLSHNMSMLPTRITELMPWHHIPPWCSKPCTALTTTGYNKESIF